MSSVYEQNRQNLPAEWPPVMIFGGLLLATLVLIGAIVGLIEGVERYRGHIRYQEGKVARQIGVPAQANPWKDYQGQRWLDGWMFKPE